MDTGSVVAANSTLGDFVVLVLVGVFMAKLSHRLKFPDVVLFLLAGILIGPAGFKLVNIGAQSVTNQLILTFGSALILFDGGMSLYLYVLKDTWRTILLLSTVGVLVTAAVTGLATLTFLKLPLFSAFLLAAVIASTDPATLIPVFKQIKIKDRVSQTVLAESVFNDATGAILTFTMLALLSTGSFSLSKSLTLFIAMTLGGLLVGSVIGFAVAYLIAHHKVGIFGQYSAVMILIAVLSSYLIAVAIGGSGYMAVFVAGIILGNMPSFGLDHHDAYAQEQHHFISNSALIVRMLIFILLGTRVDFAMITKYWLADIAVILVFMLVSRPVAVLASTLPDRTVKWQRNELLFMFWVRETGVIPAALTGFLISMNVPGADAIASVTFMAILVTLLLQASSTKAVAGKLGLLLDKESDLAKSAPLGDGKNILLDRVVAHPVVGKDQVFQEGVVPD